MRSRTAFWLTPLLAVCLAGCQEASEPGPSPDGATNGDAAVSGDGESSLGESSPAGQLAKPADENAAAAVDLQPIAPEDLQRLVAENKGKVVLFDFWATWCVPCLQQYPHSAELSETHADDLVVYSVSMDETDEETLASVKAKLGEMPAGKIRTLVGKAGIDLDAFTSFEITEGALPHYKIFGRDGKLAATLGGTENPPTPETVDAAVEAAIAAK